MSFIKKSSLFFCMLILITCSKESDAGSDAYASSASQNTYTQPTTTTTTTTVTQYTLAVTSAEGGGVSSTGGTYDDGTSVSITATPNEGYEFVGWNGTDMSSSTITIMLTANTTIEALFSQVSTTTTVTQFTLAVTAAEGGGVSSTGGTYDDGTSVTITATANEGYIFTGWEGNDSKSVSITITLNSNQTFQALFELIPPVQYTLTLIASEGGTVSTEGGIYEEGTEVTITATPSEGYLFVRWEEVDISTSSLTITVSSNISLTAIFSAVSNASNSSNLTDENEGPVLWIGETIAFNKLDYANPNLEENQDRIRDNIWITRGNSGGQIFNISLNSNANKIQSPVGTEWAIGTLDEIGNLSFDYFRNAITRPKNVVGKNLVLHLIEEDIYLTVKFISWSQGKRGGFSYERSSP